MAEAETGAAAPAGASGRIGMPRPNAAARWRALALVLVVGACSPPLLEAPPDDLLLSAGFTTQRADAPEFLAAFGMLPPHTFAIKTASGRPTWLFAGPAGCNCVYVGDEAAWDRFQRELVDQRLAAQQLQTDKLSKPLGANPYDWKFD